MVRCVGVYGVCGGMGCVWRGVWRGVCMCGCVWVWVWCVGERERERERKRESSLKTHVNHGSEFYCGQSFLFQICFFIVSTNIILT